MEVISVVERRRGPRVDVCWPLRVSALSGVGDGRITDASMCGLLFEAGIDIEEGELVTLRIAVDSSTTIDCAAQVVRRPNGNTAYAADIRYISAADRQRLSFALLVARDPGLAQRARMDAAA